MKILVSISVWLFTLVLMHSVLRRLIKQDPIHFDDFLEQNTYALCKKTVQNIGNHVLYKVESQAQPLCGSQLKTPTPCGTNNSFPVCLNTLFGRITKCYESRQLIPLCFVHCTHRRLVVSCNDSTLAVCLSADSGIRMKFCKESAHNLCLGHKIKLRSYRGIRSKRQAPQEPELDVDGYYLSCEHCKLKLKMEIDKAEEQPVIEILSEPLYEDDGNTQ